MLSTFYVGGQTDIYKQNRTRSRKLNKMSNYHLEGLEREKKGKLWHGRPPVKIIAHI